MHSIDFDVSFVTLSQKYYITLFDKNKPCKAKLLNFST